MGKILQSINLASKFVDKLKQQNSIMKSCLSAADNTKPNSLFAKRLGTLDSKKLYKDQVQIDDSILNKFKNTSLSLFDENYLGSKVQCVEALNSKNPRELVFLLDNETGECVGKYAGDAKSCKFDSPLPSRSLTLLHGHAPIEGTTKTLPVSFQDFLVLNNNNSIHKIIAFDKRGRKTFLAKGVGYEALDKSKLSTLKKEYVKHLLDNSSKDDTKHIDSLMDYCKANPNNCESIKWKVAEKITNLQYKESAVELIDSFWKNNAKSLNLEYYSGI